MLVSYALLPARQAVWLQLNALQLCMQVLYAEEQDWSPLIVDYANRGVVSEAAFMEALQKRMEGVVLGLQSGSYAQKVQAEYLKEVESRAKSVFKQLA